MVVQDFLERMGKLEVLTHVGLDDVADRLNFLLTVWLLMLVCSITTAKTYFLTPIICYIPNIVGSHEGQAAYITNFCYSEGTYNVPLSEFKIDNSNPDWKERYRDRKIYYYQWLPLVLGLQGVLCYLPRIFWLVFSSNRMGLDLSQVVKLANEAQKADPDRRGKLVGHTCKQLELWIESMRGRKQNADSWVTRATRCGLALLSCSRRLGIWLVVVYFCIKLLYIVNSVGQLLLMTRLLQLPDIAANRNSSLVTVAGTFGVQLLADLLQGRDWQNNQAFPRSGCCAVETRQASSSNFIFAQCVLPVNMLHEKIFILLWFWFVLLAVANCLSFGLWLWRMALPQLRCRTLQPLLRFSSGKADGDSLANFCSYIGVDGCFMLTMISMNCGQIVGKEVCRELFESLKKNLSKDKATGNGSTRQSMHRENEIGLQDKKGSMASLISKGRRKMLKSVNQEDALEEEAVEPSAPPEDSA